MKKLIVIGIVAAMVMGLAAAASAFTANDTWYVQLRAENGGVCQGTITAGTKPGASDDYVQVEDTGFPGAVSGAGEIIMTDLGAPGIPDGRCNKDVRAPMLVNQVKIWDMMAYINGQSAGTLTIKAWVSSSGKITSPDFYVALYDGVVTAGNYKSAKPVWVAPLNASGSSTAPQYTAVVSVDGYKRYTLVCSTQIPEPGSMAAVLSGLVGLVGFGIRRRK